MKNMFRMPSHSVSSCKNTLPSVQKWQLNKLCDQVPQSQLIGPEVELVRLTPLAEILSMQGTTQGSEGSNGLNTKGM